MAEINFIYHKRHAIFTWIYFCLRTETICLRLVAMLIPLTVCLVVYRVSIIMLFCISLFFLNLPHHKTEGKIYSILHLKPKSLTSLSSSATLIQFLLSSSCSGTAPLACLVTMLHSQVRGDRVKNSIFFKLPGRMSLFTLKVKIYHKHHHPGLVTELRLHDHTSAQNMSL